MLRMDQNVEQATLGHAWHYLDMQSLSRFRDSSRAVLVQDSFALGADRYGCVLGKLLIYWCGYFRQLPLPRLDELVGRGGKAHPVAKVLPLALALRPRQPLRAVVRERLRARNAKITRLQVVSDVGKRADFELAATDRSRVGWMLQQPPPTLARKA